MGYQTDFAESISTTPAAGQLAEDVSDLRSSRVAEVAIAPGLACTPGTAAHQLKLPTSAAEVAKCLGVSVLMPLRSESGPTFAIGDAVLYLEKGEIWVAVEEAVADGSDVYVRFATNGALTQKGAFLDNDSNPGGGATAAKLPGCRFTSTTTGAGFAKVRLNLPAT
jgi:hypothetical protein